MWHRGSNYKKKKKEFLRRSRDYNRSLKSNKMNKKVRPFKSLQRKNNKLNKWSNFSITKNKVKSL